MFPLAAVRPWLSIVLSDEVLPLMCRRAFLCFGVLFFEAFMHRGCSIVLTCLFYLVAWIFRRTRWAATSCAVDFTAAVHVHNIFRSFQRQNPLTRAIFDGTESLSIVGLALELLFLGLVRKMLHPHLTSQTLISSCSFSFSFFFCFFYIYIYISCYQ